ncbi:hypothetical protein BDY21DRAFT_353126 [Lineolata rhizophorae]|uniref:Mitochondrial cytochrome c oxidase assembly factor n=1 Tax=Lineolata rhizophorae TaxID=578093 RepID=A0A6A6NRX2_9PEZI|nr:hypothetical protein BDY21DRAFT_353126 [Lineolata rhizophorae]
MGGPNLEIFKFGFYVMFPIGIMYYFGTNLDDRFTVPDFWPKETQVHKIPTDRDELRAEAERLKRKRLERRALRLQMEELKRAREEGRSPVFTKEMEGPEESISGSVRQESKAGEGGKEGTGWGSWIFGGKKTS